MSQLNKIRVLAADDEYWSRENLRNLLSWEDYEMEFLEPACDGEEVLERMAQEHPDILLTDINMPFMDGLELLSRVQKEYPDVIAVAVSGYDDFEKYDSQVVESNARTYAKIAMQEYKTRTTDYIEKQKQ